MNTFHQKKYNVSYKCWVNRILDKTTKIYSLNKSGLIIFEDDLFVCWVWVHDAKSFIQLLIYFRKTRTMKTTWTLILATSLTWTLTFTLTDYKTTIWVQILQLLYCTVGKQPLSRIPMNWVTLRWSHNVNMTLMIIKNPTFKVTNIGK